MRTDSPLHLVEKLRPGIGLETRDELFRAARAAFRADQILVAPLYFMEDLEGMGAFCTFIVV